MPYAFQIWYPRLLLDVTVTDATLRRYNHWITRRQQADPCDPNSRDTYQSKFEDTSIRKLLVHANLQLS